MEKTSEGQEAAGGEEGAEGSAEVVGFRSSDPAAFGAIWCRKES